MVTVTRSAIKPSGYSNPSICQRFGYTAANAAAARPTKGPPKRLPRSPAASTTAVPITIDIILWSK